MCKIGNDQQTQPGETPPRCGVCKNRGCAAVKLARDLARSQQNQPLVVIEPHSDVESSPSSAPLLTPES